MLLDLIPFDRVRGQVMDEEECEVRVQVEQGAAQETIDFQNVAVVRTQREVNGDNDQRFWRRIAASTLFMHSGPRMQGRDLLAVVMPSSVVNIIFRDKGHNCRRPARGPTADFPCFRTAVFPDRRLSSRICPARNTRLHLLLKP